MLVPLIMGLVEGLTEFLPVSSTGHLILVGHLLGFTGEKASTFEIFIQLGAILAVFVFYAHRFAGFFNLNDNQGLKGARGIGMLAVTTLPAMIAGLALHSIIKHKLFNPLTVALGFIAGGIWILFAEKSKKPRNCRSLDEISWKQAFSIGCFQCLALWPGFSRSGATILGGMTMGLNRQTATQYSFFAAVPVLAAAAVFDLIKSMNVLQASDLPFFALGLLVSFVTALAVIRFFVGFVSRHSLSFFAWYRFAVAGLILYILR